MSATGKAGPFGSLPTPLTDWILAVINSLGYTEMTPVQASTIPLFMKHKDVVVEAVTGSGKTLAFVIPVLEKLVRRQEQLRREQIGAVVISPTRELAEQIHSIFNLFLSPQPSPDADALPTDLDYPPPLLLVSSDKSSPAQDVQRFKSLGSDIIVGTPGRMEEFLLGKGSNAVSVKELEVLVLDEADRLLDLGFYASLTRIITHLPKQRRTGLFSATMTDGLSELVRVGLRNPARVVVKVQSKRLKKVTNDSEIQPGEIIEERRIPANLQIFYLVCDATSKLVQLREIIAHELATCRSSRFIIYFATGACVDYFYRIIPLCLSTNPQIYSLHGHLSPSARSRTLSTFASNIATPSSPSILLATDVVARGLDLPDVDCVVQFDPPSDPKTFSHRCGRTARAGRSGRAWVLLLEKEQGYVDFLAVRKIPLTERKPFSAGENAHLECQSKIQKHVLLDRASHDVAMKAFVSFIRSYSKHEASYIFRSKDLDIVGIAKCFGLLRLPKMPELKEVDRHGWQDADVDWDTYAYADKEQEKKRISAMKAPRDSQKSRQPNTNAKKASVAWSDKVLRKEAKEKRHEQKARKRAWLKTQTASQGEKDPASTESLKRGRDAVDSETTSDLDDWNEVAKEERLAKKVRQGKLSQTEFDAEFTDL